MFTEDFASAVNELNIFRDFSKETIVETSEVIKIGLNFVFVVILIVLQFLTE